MLNFHIQNFNSTKNIDINKIVVSNKFTVGGDEGFKYFIGYKLAEI